MLIRLRTATITSKPRARMYGTMSFNQCLGARLDHTVNDAQNTQRITTAPKFRRTGCGKMFGWITP